MKVRIGIALGQWPGKDIRPEAILDLVDSFEALDVDSLWVSDRLVSTALILEPITFLSYVAGRLRKMKFGTSTLVLPTRNPHRPRQRIGDAWIFSRKAGCFRRSVSAAMNRKICKPSA